MQLRIAGTVNDSIVDGPGIRYVVFVQGCPHHCEGCHNAHTHDFNGGKIAETDDILKQIKSNPLLSGITFSGGEPFCQANQLAFLAEEIRKIDPTLDIITYTGYTFEELVEKSNETNGYLNLLKQTDILVDGKFEISKKDYQLRFRGSSNQRIIDCKKSLENKEIFTVEL